MCLKGSLFEFKKLLIPCRRKQYTDCRIYTAALKKKMFEAEIRCLSVVTTSLVSVVASFVRPSSKQYSKPCTFVVLERLTGSRLSPVPFSCHRKAVECPVSLRSLEENSAVRLNILKQTCQVFCLRVSGALFGAAFYHLAPCAPLSHSWTDMVF